MDTMDLKLLKKYELSKLSENKKFLKNMEDKRFRLLVQCCRALKMRKEATMVAMSYLETEKEIMTMLHLIKEHYRENLSEDRIIQIAQDIHKAMVSEKI